MQKIGHTAYDTRIPGFERSHQWIKKLFLFSVDKTKIKKMAGKVLFYLKHVFHLSRVTRVRKDEVGGVVENAAGDWEPVIGSVQRLCEEPGDRGAYRGHHLHVVTQFVHPT